MSARGRKRRAAPPPGLDVTESTRHPWPVAARRLQVGDLQVDLRYRRVLRDGEEVELPHRIFDLLLAFLAAPHVLHSRLDLFRQVWPGVVVEDSNLSQSIWLLRRTLGPARKDWIRTVARSGYVFEPPTSIEAVDEPALPAPPPRNDVAGPEPVVAIPGALRSPIPAATGPTPLRWRAAWIAAAVALLGVVAAGLQFGRAPEPAAVAARPLAISMIEIRDPAGAPDRGWTTTLLNAWLTWKLSLLPEVTVLSEAHLAAGADTLSPVLVLLATGPLQDEPGQMYARARIPGPGGERQIELRGDADEAVALVDALSEAVIAHVLPARADDRWPPLRLDSDGGRQFALAFEAARRHDWPAGFAATTQLLQDAPGFGPGHLQQAIIQAELGQLRSAQAHMAQARKLLRPVPEDAVPLLDAMQLALDPARRTQAAEAFRTLATDYPQRIGFRLSQASLLNAGGKPDEALVLLQAPAWDRQPVGVRIQRLLAMAGAQLTLGDPERARENARQADTLAAGVGEGWMLERGQALLLQAQADLAQRPEQADLGLFDRAAEQFDLAGSPVNALLARYQATAMRNPAAAGAQLEVLLARVREAGYRKMEVRLLQHAAQRRYQAGDHAGYRQRLEQALAVAADTADPNQQEVLKFHLVQDDLLRGDTAGAERRLSRMRPDQLDEGMRFAVARIESVFATMRGEYSVALAALARSEEQLKVGAGADPSMLASIACTRGSLLLQQGLLSPARAELERCAAREHSDLQRQAVLNLSHAALLAGDRERGLRLLDQAQALVEAMPDGPGRWEPAMNLAYLRLRSGDTQQPALIYDQVLPRVQAAGYRLHEADVLVGLAELAAVRSDWAGSRRHAAAARKLLPAGAWLAHSRLALLDAAAALARGDRERADALLVALDRRAHRHEDVLVQLEVHSLMASHGLDGHHPAAERNALVARTGMHGATAAWLQLPPTLRPAASPRP